MITAFGMLHKYGTEAGELATTHTALHGRGGQWLETAEDNDNTAQHYAAGEDAYPNMLK